MYSVTSASTVFSAEVRREEAKAMKSQEQSSQKTVASHSILLAEDDFEMRKFLAWSLENRGYDVTQCADGTSLLRKLGFLGMVENAQDYDLIISDIRMPGVSGLQVLESSREFEDFPPLILITAFPDEKVRNQARRLGAAAMLAKPFDIDELLDRVRTIIPPETETRRERNLSAGQEPGDLPFHLEISFRHHSGSGAVRDYIRQVMTKLRPFADHITSVRVVIDESDPKVHRMHRWYEVKLVVNTSGKTIVVDHPSDREESYENLYLAIHIAIGTAYKQLKRYFGKKAARRDHVRERTRAGKAFKSGTDA